MKKMIIVPAAVIVALGLAGCGAEKRHGRHRDRVRVAEYPFTALAPLYIAADEAFFAAEDIDLELKRIDIGRPASLAAFLRGEVDVDTVGPHASLLNAIARGAKVRVVAGEGFVERRECTQFAWVVRSDWFDPAGHFDSSRIRGARARYSPLGYPAFETDRALATAGLALDDLTRVPVPVPLAEQALERGDLDFAFLSEIPLTKALASRRVAVWKTLAEVVPNAQITALSFTPRLLGVDREIGVRFLMGYLRGVRAFLKGKTPRNLEILSRHLGLTREELESSCWLSFRPDGRLEFDSWIAFERWSAQQDALDRVLQPPEFANTSLLAEANRRLASVGG